MFWWTDRYRPVPVPNFDQLGSPTYHVMLAIRQLSVFAVPAFLFISGFFLAYAARGNHSSLNWKVVRVRITNLLVPYIIWSVFIFIGDSLQGIFHAPTEYLLRLVIGKADGPYFFVPLLCQFYLLSPLIVRLARAKGWWLLLVSALVQLGALSLKYLDVFDTQVLGVGSFPSWAFPTFAFFFPLGVVCGFHVEQLNRRLNRLGKILPVAVLVLGSLIILEPEIMYRITGNRWGYSLPTIVSVPYSIAAILWFLQFAKLAPSFSKPLYQLAKRSYGIYLLHSKVLEIVARVTRQIAPRILANPLLFSSLIFIFGLGIPLMLMSIVSRSPARKFYHYLFG